MKKKLLLFIFSVLLLNETFAQCNTVVTVNVVSFCGPGCFGDVTFTSTSGTPPYDLVITGGPTVQYASSYNWTNICAGTYPYTITDAALSCTDTGTVTIVSYPLPVVVASAAPIACAGDTVTLLATGALFYSWSPIANLISASVDSSVITVNPPATSTYTVVGYTLEGCTASDTVSVFVAPLPLVLPPPPPYICYGGAVVLSVSGALTYEWSPATGLSATTGSPVTANPTSTTNYTVIGTSVDGCTSAINLTVIVNPLPGITFNVTNESCVGCCDGSLTPVAPTAVSCLWSNSATTFVNDSLCAGSYWIAVYDANGCGSTSTAVIGAGTCNPAFSVTPDAITPHMYWITNSVTGTAPISYLWTWGDATSDTTAFPSHTYASEGFYDICLSITDGAGCSSTNCWSAYLARMDANNAMISVTVVSQIPTGGPNNSDSEFTLYPNPASSQFTIYDVRSTIEKIEVYSMIGERIFQPQTINDKRQTVDVSNLDSGVYFVKVKTSDGEKIQKLLVQH